MNDVDAFSRIPESVLRPYLVRKREEALKYLIAQSDMAMIHRQQGRVQLVEEMLDLLDKAKNLR